MNHMFYFLITLTAVLAATTNAGEPVLDSDGDIISNGSYYVLPAVVGAAGGGLTFTLGHRRSCPLYIAQEDSEDNNGIPVRFSNWKSKVGFVPESENLNIEMDAKAPMCVESSYWRIVPFEGGKSFVGTGPKPEAGEDSKWSYFQIKKAGDIPNGYVITSCPQDNYKFNIGVYVDDDRIRRYAITKPFPVRFVKATGTETLSKTMSII